MMQKVGRALPVVWILLAATTGLLVSGAVGCSYDSGLGGATCDPSQEGDRRDGEVCRGGYWVEDDRDAAQPDAGDADDGGSGDACIPSSEVCNDIDDDCNGRIDEGIDCSCNYLGNDRGACTDAEKDASGECQRPDAYNETEVRCGDGIDNDCDGSVDDTDADCQCSGDATRDCYTGSSETEGVGICVTGEQTCENGRWGRCENEKLPDSGEICGDGRDNDCDGSTDESCDCAYDPNEPKDIDTDGSHDAGICADRSVADSGGCSKPEDFESRTNTESNCDRLDNDCDGAVDEGCECTFDPFENDRTDTDGSHDDGVCTEQTRTTDGLCEAPGTFETKTDAEDRCDSFDNDCDGDTDEGCPCDYDNNTDGVCGGATRDASGMCQQPNEYDSTDAETSPGNCDQLDNDCDGYTDEGCPCDYDNTSNGICGSATRDANGMCQQPNDYDSTDAEASAANCDQLDNDCDGYTDERCSCDYTGTPVGVCGTATRDSAGACQEPNDYQSPETDLCDDGIDNDCDGDTDASSKDGGESCNVDCECHSGSCDGGSCRHRVFVTSDQHSPDFGSLSSADTKCDDIASNAGLKGNWRAVLSDSSTDATSRITVDAAVDELDGDEVAGDASDFWSDSHSEDLDIAEDQSNLSNCGDGCDDDHVWTGTTTSGTGQGNYCGDWTSTNSNATAGTGDAGRTNSEWVEETTEPCDKQLHLYCIDGQ